jgi:hypothetical protein
VATNGGGLYLIGSSALTNGTISGNTALGNGGGIYMGVGATVSGMAITGNTALVNGGGVYMSDGNLTGNTLSGNAAVNGGGTYQAGGTASGDTIQSNTAANGGGIYQTGGTANGCTLQGNETTNSTAGGGGGAYLTGTGVLTNCLVTRNASIHFGGGAYQAGGMLVNCLIQENTAVPGGNGMGGGVYTEGGVSRGCLVNGNRSGDKGGGIHLSAGTNQNCTVASNRSDNAAGSGIGMTDGLFRNGIVYGNTSGAYGSASNCCVTGGTVDYTCSSDDLSALGAGNIQGNPMFYDLTLNDFRLLTNSPCINLGINEAWMSSAYDLRGTNRIVDGTVDMGAYEGGYRPPPPRYTLFKLL